MSNKMVMCALAIVIAAPALCLGAGSTDPGTYFGIIKELDGVDVDRLREILSSLGERCSNLEKRCDAGDEFYRLIAGDLNMAALPMHLVYIDSDGDVRTNLVLHRHRVTPFLYGQSNVWVVVFSEKPVNLEARPKAEPHGFALRQGHRWRLRLHERRPTGAVFSRAS